MAVRFEHRKQGIRASGEADKQKLEVELYALNDRVNQLFFGIMLLNEQLEQNRILQDELATNYKRVEAYKQNGVANQTDLDALRVEQLFALQRESELKTTRKSFLEMLSAITGELIDEKTVFEKPIITSPDFTTENKRPELQFFDAQIIFWRASVI
jgi:hypothetical protein